MSAPIKSFPITHFYVSEGVVGTDLDVVSGAQVSWANVTVADDTGVITIPHAGGNITVDAADLKSEVIRFNDQDQATPLDYSTQDNEVETIEKGRVSWRVVGTMRVDYTTGSSHDKMLRRATAADNGPRVVIVEKDAHTLVGLFNIMETNKNSEQNGLLTFDFVLQNASQSAPYRM